MDQATIGHRLEHQSPATHGYICVACGTQFAAADEPPAACLVCEDPRQPARQEGQRWITLAELGARHDNLFRVLEPGLVGIGTVPTFAAGQRALLVRTPSGNVLWAASLCSTRRRSR